MTRPYPKPTAKCRYAGTYGGYTIEKPKQRRRWLGRIGMAAVFAVVFGVPMVVNWYPVLAPLFSAAP